MNVYCIILIFIAMKEYGILVVQKDPNSMES